VISLTMVENEMNIVNSDTNNDNSMFISLFMNSVYHYIKAFFRVMS